MAQLPTSHRSEFDLGMDGRNLAAAPQPPPSQRRKPASSPCLLRAPPPSFKAKERPVVCLPRQAAPIAVSPERRQQQRRRNVHARRQQWQQAQFVECPSPEAGPPAQSQTRVVIGGMPMAAAPLSVLEVRLPCSWATRNMSPTQQLTLGLLACSRDRRCFCCSAALARDGSCTKTRHLWTSSTAPSCRWPQQVSSPCWQAPTDSCWAPWLALPQASNGHELDG